MMLIFRMRCNAHRQMFLRTIDLSFPFTRTLVTVQYHLRRLVLVLVVILRLDGLLKPK